MGKALAKVALVVGVVALAATGIGLAVGAAGVFAGLTGATLTTIGAIAGVAAGVASLGAQLLTKPPPARGSITQVTVASDAAQPYLMGETYFGGVLRHDTGYGATLKKVPNPYRGMAIVYSGCGPLEQLVAAQVDFTTIGAYYSGFLALDSQLGDAPESAALVPPLSAPMPGWSAASKLSGQAAILWNFKFDKEGKVFSSGLPVLGAVWKGVKVYDPRLDTTYPGGVGAHRIANEATWAYSENPALHALAYAFGRHQNGKLVMGVGLSIEAIRVADFVTLANVCAANGWRLSGVISEPGDRWANLKEILAAGAAEPVFAGGLLSLRLRSPQVALDTITAADLTDASISVTAMQSYRDRLNTVIPKYRSPAHNWELVSASQVQVPSYLAEDGEEMVEELAWGLVRDVNQATQLAAYRLVDGRELGPITLTCGPRLRMYRPGECLTLNLPEVGLTTDAVILTRVVDPATMAVTFTLIGETAAKHAYALGRTGTPPPTPALGQTGAQRDELAAAAADPVGYEAVAIRGAAAKNSRDVANVARAMLTARDAAGTITISIARHDWDYPTEIADVTRALMEITVNDAGGALAASTTYFVYFDDLTLANAAPVYKATTDAATGQNSTANPARHPLGSVLTPALGAAQNAGAGYPGYGYDFNIYF